MLGRVWALITVAIGAAMLLLLAVYGVQVGTWVDEAGILPVPPPSFLIPFAIGGLAVVLIIGGIIAGSAGAAVDDRPRASDRAA